MSVSSLSSCCWCWSWPPQPFQRKRRPWRPCWRRTRLNLAWPLHRGVQGRRRAGRGRRGGEQRQRRGPFPLHCRPQRLCRHLPEQALQGLQRNPLVAYIEADQVMQAFATQNNATWGLDRIDQRNLPLSGTYTYDYTGTGVKAYIIDTGILYSHNDFGGRASFGYDAFGGNGSDCNGHGTHVAGTVGGTTWGVAKIRQPGGRACVGLQRLRHHQRRHRRRGLGDRQPRQAGRSQHEPGRRRQQHAGRSCAELDCCRCFVCRGGRQRRPAWPAAKCLQLLACPRA
jgi:hypothetical protein